VSSPIVKRARPPSAPGRAETALKNADAGATVYGLVGHDPAFGEDCES